MVYSYVILGYLCSEGYFIFKLKYFINNTKKRQVKIFKCLLILFVNNDK